MTAIIADAAAFSVSAIGFDCEDLLFCSTEADSAMTPLFCSRAITQSVVAYLAVYSQLTSQLFKVFRCVPTFKYAPRIVAVCGRMQDDDVKDLVDLRCLQYLNLSDCIMKSSSLATLGTNQPLLTKVDLSACCFDDEGMRMIGNNLPYLSYLDVSENPNLGQFAVFHLRKLKRSLKFLNISNCNGIDSEGLKHLEELENLIDLNIAGNEHFTIELFDHLPWRCGRLILHGIGSKYSRAEYLEYDQAVELHTRVSQTPTGSGFPFNSHVLARQLPPGTGVSYFDKHRYQGPLQRPPLLWKRLDQELPDLLTTEDEDETTASTKNDDNAAEIPPSGLQSDEDSKLLSMTLIERLARRLPFLVELNISDIDSEYVAPRSTGFDALKEFCPHLKIVDATGLHFCLDTTQVLNPAVLNPATGRPRRQRLQNYQMGQVNLDQKKYFESLPFRVYHQNGWDRTKRNMLEGRATEPKKTVVVEESYSSSDDEMSLFG